MKEKKKGFDVDALLALLDVSEIAVSPEGEWVAYTVTGNDVTKDERTSIVWMAPFGGGDPVRMTSLASGADRPRWSPDGNYLAVLSDRRGDTDQVWLLNRLGGDAQQLTSLPQGVNSFWWSPDSSRVLLSVDDPSPADLDKEERANPRPWVIDRLQFKEDYVGYLDRCRTHLHLIDLESRVVRQLTSGDFDDSEPAWSPDGHQIVFVSNRTEMPDRNRNTELWIIDVDDEEPVPRQLTESSAADTGPSWSPDGTHIVFTSTDPRVLSNYAIPRMTVIDVNTKQLTTFPEILETQAMAPRYSADGRRILAITEDRGQQNLIEVDVSAGTVVKLIEGEDTVSEISTNRNDQVAVLVSRPGAPDEVYRIDDGQLGQVTATNGELMQGIDTGEVREIHFSGSDGTALHGLVTFPPDFDKSRRYPGLLMIHGGPQAQFDFRFDWEAQILAAAGYVVVMPNPRGSWGFGQGFAMAIYRDWGGLDSEDVLASMDFAIEEGWVDPDRTGVLGWSYGGMITNHIITKTARFKAAITGASATLYMANYGHDQYQRWWEEELGLPWLPQNRDKWDRISPFFRLHNVTTPTLIVGGEDDWNIPIHNSEQLYIALKRQGVPTELVVYPEQGHAFDVPSYNKDLYTRYVDWFGRYLQE